MDLKNDIFYFVETIYNFYNTYFKIQLTIKLKVNT